MSGAIEDIAKKWLSEPAYTKVRHNIINMPNIIYNIYAGVQAHG